MTLLAVENLSAGHTPGGVVRGVSFTVAPGSTCVLAGPAGAGKSAVLCAVAGLVPSWEGDVFLEGWSVAGVSVTGRLRAGIALCPQGGRVFPGLTVLDNLLLGAWQTRRQPRRNDALLDRVFTDFPVLEPHSGARAGELPEAEQRLLAVGRALMSRPRLLLLDDPAAGLPDAALRTLREAVTTTVASGTAVVVAEGTAGLLPQPDQVIVLSDGPRGEAPQ